MDAFISHASKDAALAARIGQALADDGLQAWLDRSQSRAGALLRKELQDAIEASRVLVLLWSKAAAKSRWVAAEVLTAFHTDRHIVGCVRGEAPLPYFLQTPSIWWWASDAAATGSSACAAPCAKLPTRPTS